MGTLTEETRCADLDAIASHAVSEHDGWEVAATSVSRAGIYSILIVAGRDHLILRTARPEEQVDSPAFYTFGVRIRLPVRSRNGDLDVVTSPDYTTRAGVVDGEVDVREALSKISTVAKVFGEEVSA